MARIVVKVAERHYGAFLWLLKEHFGQRHTPSQLFYLAVCEVVRNEAQRHIAKPLPPESAPDVSVGTAKEKTSGVP